MRSGVGWIGYVVGMHGDEEQRTETHELREAQGEREAEESRLAAEAELPDEAAQHRRRRDKAEYLKQKLAEREEAERG